MITPLNFPKNVTITIEHLPTGKMWKCNPQKIYNQEEFEDVQKLCCLMTRKEAVAMAINNSDVYFPASVLQKSVIHLDVQ